MELWRVLGALAEPPCEEHQAMASSLNLGPVPEPSAHTDLFGFQLYPYASVYLGEEGMMGGEARDRIAGFWRALGQTPPKEPDHLSVLLSAYAELCERDIDVEAGWRRARKAFFWEHLAGWLPIYLQKVGRHADAYYRRWSRLMMEVLGEEAQALGPLDRTPLCLRDSPGLIDPRQESDEAEPWFGALLAPARSGFVLVRDDLRKLGAKLGLAVRAGERRFVLQNLLGQDAAAVLSYLADFARSQPELADHWAQVGEVWNRRRRAGAELLQELADEAGSGGAIRES